MCRQELNGSFFVFVFLYFCIFYIFFVLLKRIVVCRWLAIPVNKQRGIGPQSARLELTFPLVGGQARHEKSGNRNEEDLQRVECKSHVIGLIIDPGPASCKEDSPVGQYFFCKWSRLSSSTILLQRGRFGTTIVCKLEWLKWWDQGYLIMKLLHVFSKLAHSCCYIYQRNTLKYS